MKSTLLAACFLFLFSTSRANVSDTIHVSHYSISIDTISYSAHTLRAVTQLTVHPKMNGINTIPLSLFKLIPDSVISQSAVLPFTYNDTTLVITLPFALNI